MSYQSVCPVESFIVKNLKGQSDVTDEKKIHGTYCSLFRKLLSYQPICRTTSHIAITWVSEKSGRSSYQTTPKGGRDEATRRSQTHLAVWWSPLNHLSLPTNKHLFQKCRKWSWAVRHTKQSLRSHTFLYYTRLLNTTQLPSNIGHVPPPIHFSRYDKTVFSDTDKLVGIIKSQS